MQTGHAGLQDPAAEGPRAKQLRLLWHAAERHSHDAPVSQGTDAFTKHTLSCHIVSEGKADAQPWTHTGRDWRCRRCDGATAHWSEELPTRECTAHTT